MLRLAFTLCVSLAASVAAQPANDTLADAFVIAEPGTVTGTSVGATLESGEPVPSCQTSHGASVWWTFTPPEDGLLAVDLAGSDFDTILTFHQPGTDEIACDDDIEFPAVTSRLADVPVTGGEPVAIRVSGFDGTNGVAQGAITLRLGFSTGALVTTTLPPGDTTGGDPFHRPASLGTGASGSCTLSAAGTAVPFAERPFVVDVSGAYTLSIDDSATPGFDSYLFLYAGTFDPADPCLGLIALNDDGTPAPDDAQIAGIPLDAGGYTLVVGGVNNLDFGQFVGDVVGPAAVLFTVVSAEAPPDTGARLTLAPNPTRGAARIRLDLDHATDLTVEVLDAVGRQVAVLHRGRAVGALDLRLDGASLPAGVYVVRAVSEGLDVWRRVVVVR